MNAYDFWKEYSKAMESAKKKQDAKPKPTIEQCAALLKNLLGHNDEWHIAIYAEHDVRIYNNLNLLCSFISLDGLHAHLLACQPSKTVTVEILREDADEFVNGPLYCASDSRIADAFKKGLRAS